MASLVAVSALGYGFAQFSLRAAGTGTHVLTGMIGKERPGGREEGWRPVWGEGRLQNGFLVKVASSKNTPALDRATELLGSPPEPFQGPPPPS